MKVQIFGIAVAASLLAGCVNTVRGGPERVYSASLNADRANALVASIDEYCFKLPEQEQPASVKSANRNDVVFAYMLLADRRYYVFESAILNETSSGNFSANALSLALSTAGALAGESAAQTLSALDTGVKGATQSFGKEFLFDQTVPALINQMRASRAAVRTRIYEGTKASHDDWPLCLALQELTEYEQAGTLTGAITTLTSTAVADKMAREGEAQRELTASFQSSALSEVISRYADKSLPQDELTRRLNLLVSATKQASLGETKGDFLILQASGHPEDLQRLIEEAQKLEKDPSALRLLVVPGVK
jgi:predicted small secreted protein